MTDRRLRPSEPRRRLDLMLRRGSLLWLEISVGAYNLIVGAWTAFGAGTFELDSYGAFEGPAWLWGGVMVGVALMIWSVSLTRPRRWRISALVLSAIVNLTRAWFFYESAPASGGVAAAFSIGLLSALGATVHTWRLLDEHGRSLASQRSTL
ncbi:MAG: hypothetical protein AAGI91_17475 [Bacteroidota bacterium]